MSPMPHDDKRTLEAIGILADALDGVSGAGVLDTVLVSKALRQVLATKSRPAYDFASRAFSTLAPEVKRQVAADARVKARDFARRDDDELPRALRSAATAAPVSASVGSILGALNNRGRMPRRPGSK